LLFYFIITLNKQTHMGRGDIKTKKGKIFAGSFGKTRSAKSTAAVKSATAKKAAAAKKA
jgi:30S ribosomal protein S31